jgi:hypothetical protein
VVNELLNTAQNGKLYAGLTEKRATGRNSGLDGKGNVDCRLVIYRKAADQGNEKAKDALQRMTMH